MRRPSRAQQERIKGPAGAPLLPRSPLLLLLLGVVSTLHTPRVAFCERCPSQGGHLPRHSQGLSVAFQAG